MKRIGYLLIFLILVASFFVGYKSSGELVIDVSTLPSSNNPLTSYLENSAAFEYSSGVEMLFLENGTIRANETLILRTVGNASTGKVAISYLYPLIKIRSLRLENAKLANASISQGKDIIYLAFKPKGRKTTKITIEYELNWKDILPSGLGSFGLLINQSTRETILTSVYFPHVEIKGTKTNSMLVLKLPKGWWAFVVDSSSYAPWKLGDSKLSDNQRILRFEQKNPAFPLIFVGEFNRFTKVVTPHEKIVNITVYMPTNESERGNATLSQVENIVKTFSKWYGDYPYNSLNVVVSRLVMSHAGLNLGNGVLIVSARGFDVWLLSHEISHSWFGSYADLGKISESLATFSAIAYVLTHSENVPSNFLDISENISMEQDIPLAKAYSASLSLRKMYPIIYRKGGLVFRSLQFVLGNETFFEGLRQVVRECHDTSCGLKRIQEIFENVSNQDLDWFFDEWFYSAKVPDYEGKNFTIVQNNGKYLLNFEIIDRNNFTMPLEVKVETDKGSTVKRIWIRGKARVAIECEGKPLAVILDPHEWMINENKEYQINGVKIVIE